LVKTNRFGCAASGVKEMLDVCSPRHRHMRRFRRIKPVNPCLERRCRCPTKTLRDSIAQHERCARVECLSLIEPTLNRDSMCGCGSLKSRVPITQHPRDRSNRLQRHNNSNTNTSTSTPPRALVMMVDGAEIVSPKLLCGRHFHTGCWFKVCV
jgi:hypothetical protein